MSRSANFEVRPVAPFRLDLTVWTIRRRPENVIDRWDGSSYRRVLTAEDGTPFQVSVSQVGSAEAPHLRVVLEGAVSPGEAETPARRGLDRLLGLQVDLRAFYAAALQDGDLRALASRFRGLKPPRFPTYFETLVNAMACQQISLNVGIQLLARLAQRYGPGLETEGGTFHAFPRPQDVADADPDEMRAMGFSHQKARYITGLAQAITEGELNLCDLETLDDEAAIDRLLNLKGAGRWTAEYFLLRGLGRTHIFPADDVGARNNLQKWLRLRAPMKYERVQRALRPWSGYGGLVYFHLLLRSLDERGALRIERKAMLKVKRVYEKAEAADGTRFLVERLWPRGMKKEKLKMKAWLKEAAPSDGLRRWFTHDPAKWAEFQRRYRAELGRNLEAVRPILEAAKHGDVTLLFSAHDTEHNNALVLKDYVAKMSRKG